MVDTVARLKLKGKHFEVIVDCDKAITLRKQKAVNPTSIREVLAVGSIFSDHKKGLKWSNRELFEAFGTHELYEITSRIVAEGEILLPQEYREKERELKLKQVVDFLTRNCVDPRTHAPYTAERILNALKQIGIRIDETRGVDEQALSIIKELEKIMPIKIETKRIKLIIPAAYTGKVYGMLSSFKREKEEWSADGSLSCIIDLPAGLQLEFYDKLNAITHGAAITEEVKE